MNAFQTYYLSIFTDHYADFEGKADRREFWMYTLFNVFAVIIFYLLDNLFFGGRFYLFLSLYGLIKFIPELALAVRRLHDIGKTGYTLFWGLIPIIGAIYLIVLFCMDSEYGLNTHTAPSVSTPKQTPPSAQKQSSTTNPPVSKPNTGVEDIRKKWGGTSSPSTSNSPASPSTNEGAENIRRKW